MLLGGFAVAQIDETEEWDTVSSPTVMKRKRPGIFRRAAEETPAAQLELARKLEESGKERAAMRAYRALVHNWHDTREAARAQMAYAVLLKEAGKYQKAFDEFQYMVEFYPGDHGFTEVLTHQFEIAVEVMNKRYLRFLGLPGYRAPERALPLFEQITQNAPRWEKTDETYFYIGRLHEMRDRYEDAVVAYEVVQRRFPAGEFALEAAYRRVECLRRLALKYPRDEQLIRNALSACAGFLAGRGSDSEYQDAVKDYLAELKAMLSSMYYERAVFYDKLTDRRDSVLLAYRDYLARFPDAAEAEEARERVEHLESITELPDDQ